MSLFAALIKLWMFRLALFLVVGTGLVLLLHAPGGDRYTRGEKVNVNGRIITPMIRHWSWAAYGTELRAFAAQINTRQLPHYTQAQMQRGEPTDFWPVLTHSWRNSALLLGVAVGVGSTIGLLMGSLYAFRSRLGRLLGMTTATVGLSLPDFLVVAIGQSMAIWAWHAYDFRLWYILADPTSVKHALLPIIALSLAPMGFMSRVTANALDEIMREDYIRTARAKGLHEWTVITGHAYRNAIPRILTGLPTLMSFILSSLVVVERMTNWPGFARFIMEGFSRDTTGVIMGKWIGTSPQIAATAGLILLGCFLVLEGLAHTLRILYGSRLEEVRGETTAA